MHDEAARGGPASVLRLGEAVSETCGRSHADVPDRRRSAVERLIAAHALAVDAVQAICNKVEVAGYPGSRVENGIERHEKGPVAGAFS